MCNFQVFKNIFPWTIYFNAKNKNYQLSEFISIHCPLENTKKGIVSSNMRGTLYKQAKTCIKHCKQLFKTTKYIFINEKLID